MITCLINQVKGVLRGRGYSQGDLHKFRCSVKCEYSKGGLDKVRRPQFSTCFLSLLLHVAWCRCRSGMPVMSGEVRREKWIAPIRAIIPEEGTCEGGVPAGARRTALGCLDPGSIWLLGGPPHGSATALRA